ncbi:hypothetical protein F4560_000856 [Saccharothrix ecbatanensis]|uniref:Uncharacterized protein n=1 Tax=Saccharothrix ecbatanensis TaxID=1105145 RepID=A0A7W9LYW4_9PSEU|nr:hypothetical protein [Saccharothrix ecbatanensis]MBB5801088.1 hypothetical protein [Saccharothrix ecbatanensis]
MTAQEDAEIAVAIGRVCAEEPAIRALLEEAGDAAPLDQFLAAARGGQELTAPVTTLHAALQRSGDALGLLGAVRTATPWGLGQMRPVDVVLLCPRHRCSRTQVPSSDKSTRCTLFDEPLRPERI